MKHSLIYSFPVVATLCSAPLSAVEAPISPKLSTAASKIDTTGDFVSLNRVDGDIALLTAYLEKFIEVGRANGEIMPANFDLKQVIRLTGLDQIKTIARSNSLKGDIWLNQLYLENGGSQQGIFSLLGGKAEPFAVPRMSPAGTDLAFQFTLDLSQSPSIIRSLADSMGEGEAAERELQQPIPSLDTNIQGMLKKSKARFNLAIDFDQNQQLDLGGISIGRPNVVARVDGINWIWDKLGDDLINDNGIPLIRSSDNNVITYSLPAELAEAMQGYSPVIVVDNNNNQIWMASSQAFLDLSRKAGSQLIDDPQFVATWKDLPANGNAMIYISKDVIREVKGLYQTAIEQEWIDDDDFEMARPVIDLLVDDLTKSDNGFAFSIANDADGIHFSQKLPFPSKYTQLLQTLAAIKNSADGMNDDFGDVMEDMQDAE